ncbi:diaminopropionate ammonia-lyase [Streptomyces sp. NBC_01618]|uniref:diaminopropionate ammonia-lyase n=1 Tax=Streptomyces sp. NBC_01618 TaxID=2975900 RepID=UPI00386E27AC|nr:diaminopropionate ammonia-lyase [Streptomyces sp. NBC_01618]
MTGAVSGAVPSAPARWTPNRHRSGGAPYRSAPDASGPVRLSFHRHLPSYAVTPLHDLPSVAADLGVARVAVKDESSRLGLPAFKMLGASWAAYRALAARYGEPKEPTVEALRARIEGNTPVTLVTATDGNHGRAVARMASHLGLDAMVLIPDVVSEAAIQAIRDEDADVRVLADDYDATVRAAARLCEDSAGLLLVQDTSWPGYETAPRWIVDGYATLFEEAVEQLGGSPALLVVPAGVGSLAHAAALHCQRNPGWRAVTVEPEAAPCIAASLAAGHSVTTRTSTTTMAGLNCGTPSSLAFPDLLATLDGGIWVTDAEAAEAGARLADAGIDSGPCGAASLAALQYLKGAEATEHLLTPDSTVVLLNTEAAPRKSVLPE